MNYRLTIYRIYKLPISITLGYRESLQSDMYSNSIKWLLILAVSLPISVNAQSTEETDNPEADSKKKSLNVRVVALGHRRLAKFQRSDKAKIIKIKTPDGETIEETIPAGVPIEVKGKPFE